MVLKPCKEWEKLPFPQLVKNRRISEPSDTPPPPGNCHFLKMMDFLAKNDRLVGGRVFSSFPEVAQPVEAVSQIKWGSPNLCGEVAVAIAGSLGKKN